jgi:hypothetical protein
VAGIKEVHDTWRQECDVTDAVRFPTVVVGPQILSFDGMSRAHHERLLTETERQLFFLREGESTVDVLREKLAPLRRSEPLIALAQRERIAWLATLATGTQVSAVSLGNTDWVAEVDSNIARDISTDAFQANIDRYSISPSRW